MSVGAGAKLNIELEATEPNSILKWTFRTDQYDIGFAVYNEQKEEVYGNKKYDSHIELQQGFLLCETPGKCKTPTIYNYN